jgi:hypothetical protein
MSSHFAMIHALLSTMSQFIPSLTAIHQSRHELWDHFWPASAE